MKLKALIIAVLLCIGCANHTVVEDSNFEVSLNKEIQTLDNATNLDGVYELVSETTETNFPEQKIEKRTSDEWQGVWFFQNGMFSQTMMKTRRPEWTPAHFPPNARETGFDGTSGSYRIDKGQIQMSYQLTFYPGRAFDDESWSYNLEKDVLTLTRTFRRSRENYADGSQIIMLKKLR